MEAQNKNKEINALRYRHIIDAANLDLLELEKQAEQTPILQLFT